MWSHLSVTSFLRRMAGRNKYLDCLFSVNNSFKNYMIDKYDSNCISSNMTKNAVWSYFELATSTTACRFQDCCLGIPVSNRPRTCLSGWRLPARRWCQCSPTPLSRHGEVRCPSHVKQLRRPVLCSGRTTSVQHTLPVPLNLRLCDSLGQFKRSLKTFLFGLWDHGALWH